MSTLSGPRSATTMTRWTGLRLLRQLQRHRIHLANEQTVVGLSTITAEQVQLFTSLKLPKPTATNPLTAHL